MMRGYVFIILALVGPEFAFGQAMAPSAPAMPEVDPAKVAEYQQRFNEGYALEQQGKLAEARTIFDGIIAEQPEAKRSLLEAGRISLELNDPLKADGYLEKLHEIVPDFPEAFELLIQANQALKRDVKVERLVREYRALYDTGKIPELKPYFERELIKLDGGEEIVFRQFFDFTKPPFYALMGELLGPDHERKRLLLLKYDPDGTRELQAKDPRTAHDVVFIVAELFYTGKEMTRIDVYQQLLATPDYEKARNIMLGIFSQTPKPIYSAPVNPGDEGGGDGE
jgi:tetratricopeptide (TPR) repeat protein